MRFVVYCAIILACASLALAAPVFVKGKFKETRTGEGNYFKNAYLSGTFYYFYDAENLTNSRLRFKYDVNGMVVSNLYYFERKTLYSMCPKKCAAETIEVLPDKWWYSSTDYTKTQEQEDGKYWYTHNAPAGLPNSVQVSRILMTEDTTPTSNSLSAIEFADGRKIRVSEVEVNPGTLTASSSEFQTDSGLDCPLPTCSMYADLIFVLDGSGSVDELEWAQSKNFVAKVMELFTFGDYGAAAAVIQFNAPPCGVGGSMRTVECISTTDGKKTNERRHSKDYDFSECPERYLTPDYTASVISGEDFGEGQTLSTNDKLVIDTLSGATHPPGDTCQAFGLELAIKVLERSPRRKRANKPDPVIIAVTDGFDWCPNRTTELARKLRDEYHALFIGVSVGLKCIYDEEFMESLSSKFTSNQRPSAFTVANYKRIHTVAQKMFTPLCEERKSACGPDCLGFCGCGECLCPTCTESTNEKCSENVCTVREGTTAGCVETPIHSCPKSDKCSEWSCKSEDGECEEKKTCAEVIKKNQGRCRSVSCDYNDGSCTVTSDNRTCDDLTSQYRGCVKWRCANENETADDVDSGCVIEENITEYCEKLSENSCMKYTCNTDEETRDSQKCLEEDTCKINNNMCFTYNCDNNVCVATQTEPPSPNKCYTHKCSNLTGWDIDEDSIKTPEVCESEAITRGDNTTCRSFNCDEEEGCFAVLDEKDCDVACGNMLVRCQREAEDQSTIFECKVGKCRSEAVGEDVVGRCYSSESVNCLDQDSEVFRNVSNKNKNFRETGICYTIACRAGKCVPVEVPNRPAGNKCWQSVCVRDDNVGWKWDLEPTEDNQRCVSNECFRRMCVNESGCVSEDICKIRSTECMKYTCKNAADSEVKCLGEEVNFAKLECKHETCINNTKVWVLDDLEEACYSENKCRLAKCGDDGKCFFYDREPKNPDPCIIYECDPLTGNFNEKPKCDDGKACTDDKCSYTGECRQLPINCYLHLDMEGYPCLRAQCKENGENFRCVRKMIPGTFVDICGNCIKADNGMVVDDDEDSTSSSQSFSESRRKNSEDIFNCLDVPNEPLLKEGLAAASIAMIVLGAIIIGASITTSSVIGTKTLLDRARAANNQSAHTNPLFEDNQHEMTNPTFLGE